MHPGSPDDNHPHSTPQPHSTPRPHSNAIRGPLNAAGLRALEGMFDRALGDIKRKLLDDHPDRIVEFGSGPGTNMRYLRPGSTLVAVEPNAAMHKPLAAAAAAHDISLELLACGAEQVPLDDASVDTVLCTLVLCTVPDPAQALAEAVRILRPGGQLLFIEHVAAPPGSSGVTATGQRMLQRPWRWLFEGCELRRSTEQTLAEAGFGHLELQRRTLRPAAVPVSPMVWGRAIR